MDIERLKPIHQDESTNTLVSSSSQPTWPLLQNTYIHQ